MSNPARCHHAGQRARAWSGLLAPWRFILIGVALTASLGGCAQTPRAERGAPPPPGAASSARAVAAQVTVHRQGARLGRVEREALVKRLGEQGSATLVQRHLAAMLRFGEVDLHAGNEAKLLVDGPATFSAMFAAIASARKSVLLESYIIEDDSIAQQLAALLARKRAEGVQVAVLYDAVGSIGTSTAYFDSLRSSGVSVCAFNPVNPLSRPGYWNITHRDHRKILAVDRVLAFTGGINISAVYSSGSSGGAFLRARKAAATEAGSGNGWRDTQIQLRGPAAEALDDLVRQTWLQQSCPGALPVDALRRVSAAAPGPHVVRVVPTHPDDSVNQIYALLLNAIDASERSVHFTMAYFAPGSDMVDALCEAAGRGVDVRLVLPSESDFSPVLHAGRSYYDRMLVAGIKIYELQDAVLHAKTAVIDGVVSTVGSSNLDWRSLASNNEVNAVVIGEDFGDVMARAFQRDMAASKAIELVAWRNRPLWQRTKEALAHAFEGWW